ncbi:MAG: rRNA pseudouridine synthase [Gammaproteobacteria bacterium]|nr:rRNA pseudouridine synthase [Gammaproteobacteria bacterium]MBU1506922.1 rRNA pseudouridine synthase [Gammaproteobacteria bacterium]MBU2121876.1 rRNA pseudouridine synthase [Gammaproteobacteria bacterium]MBU2172895.1 rRNA pseudouridine synthase [Gammaproteobacteria bacterium]MBU2200601.1 rRNA pseudouridine synthase [Gammaproteobacteria bacterium]
MTEKNPDPTHIRLVKRVAEQLNCSRSTAEQFVEGGFVSVDGQVVEAPGARVRPDQTVTVAKDASLLELTPVTLLLHKPAGFEAGLGQPAAGGTAHASRSQGATPATSLLEVASHLAEDASGIRVLQRHFKQLECFTPLPTEASGLVVYTQDKRIARKLAEDIESLEQECIVEVKGDIANHGLQRLCHGLTFNGRPLPPIKVSWQSETKLRFALKGIRPGQIPAMCDAVGLSVVAIKRIRIGRVPLAKVPEGQWRYLQPWERF